MLSFCFTFTVSVYSSHSPIPCRISLVQVGVRPCNLAGRASPPPQPPALRPPSSVAGAAARRRLELFGPGAPSKAESPGELGCSGVRCRCGLPPTATHPGDARTDCRAPLVATFRSSLPFGDLHKGCHSAGGWGAKLQMPAALAAMPR